MDFKNKLDAYVKNIKQTDNIAVLYHFDCGDGLCSGLIITKAIERIIGRKIDFVLEYRHYEITNEILEFFKNTKISKAIFVDIALYKEEDMIKKAAEVVDLLIIDHHEFKNDISFGNVLFIHPDLMNCGIKSHKYPASKLVYDLFLHLVDIKDLDWVSCLGLTSDRGYDVWKEFVDKTMKKYNVKGSGSVESNDFWIAIENLRAGKRFKELNDTVFKILYDSKSYLEIVNDQILLECRAKIDKESNYWINKIDEAEVYGSLVVFYIKPKYHIKLATLLSFGKFASKTVIVIADYGEEILTASARDQTGNVRTNDLLQNAVKGIPGANAGGHIPASGATFKREYYEQFKKDLIEEYKKMRVVS